LNTTVYGDILARDKVQTAISKEVHEKLKKYCDENNKILYKVVDEAVIDYLSFREGLNNKSAELDKINKRMMEI